MTLPPERIGDKGQRFEVQALGYPKDGKWGVIGWTNTREGAERMAAAIAEAPGCTATKVVDRQGGNGCKDGR